MEKDTGAPGVVLHAVHILGTEDGRAQDLDIKDVRRSIDRLLRKSSRSLAAEVTTTHANLVVMQAVENIPMDDSTMDYALWGDDIVDVMQMEDGTFQQAGERSENGLFDGDSFSHVCGVVLVPTKASPVDEQFSGTYFPNLMHLQHMEHHPAPFLGMEYRVRKI